MYGSLLPKANGGGDRRDYAHSKRAIQRILSSVFTVTRWHDDTSFSTFRLARGQAGKIRPKVPACPRESKSSEITVTSVTLSPRSRLFPRRKSKTYDAKVSYLRYESQGLMPRNSGTPAKACGCDSLEFVHSHMLLQVIRIIFSLMLRHREGGWRRVWWHCHPFCLCIQTPRSFPMNSGMLRWDVFLS